ncbi:Hypothetical protein KVN_LOCUS82 [uncultured virus]|nr:Hypothetical protein KVN_LOCUS82 [uncultured virus]
MDKEIRILAIDIESSGPKLTKNVIIAIGFCLGDEKGNTLEKKTFCFKFDSFEVFDLKCLNEFWINHLDKLNVYLKTAKEPNESILDFITEIDYLDDAYDLRIISDNPSFDITFINYYLDKYLDRLPLNYKHNGKQYRCIYDTSSFSRGLLKMDYKNPILSDLEIINKYGLSIQAIHDHYPENDAEYIYKLNIALINKNNFIVKIT